MVNERGACAFALGACYADYLLAEALKEHLSFAGYLAFQLRNRLFQYDSRALEHHIEAVKAVLISLSADKLHTIGDIVGFAVDIIEVCNGYSLGRAVLLQHFICGLALSSEAEYAYGLVFSVVLDIFAE
jgi:hypothetical protein